MAEHRKGEDDRCLCGNMIVYWDDRDPDGFFGEGCEVGGVFPVERAKKLCQHCEEPIMNGRRFAVMADPKFWDTRPFDCRPDFLMHEECGIQEGLEKVLR